MVDNKTRVKWLNKIKEDTFALKDADDSIKQDKEIVLAAVANYADAIQYADASLKKDKEIVLAAVASKGQAIQ